MTMAESARGGRVRLADGRSLVFERWGRAGGRPLLWIGGNPSSRFSRHPDPGFYDRHDVDAVTFDRPGYGQSSRWPGRRVADTARDVESLLDALGWDRCDIVGLSGGGAHALACGAYLSERLSAIAVGGCPSPPTETPEWDTDLLSVNRRSLELVRQSRDGLDEELRVAAERIAQDPLTAVTGMMEESPEPDIAMLQRAEVVAMLTESLSEAFAISHYGWFDDTVAINTDWGFALRTVAVPVLVFHGALDRNAPTTQARALADQLPHAALTVWHDVGHISAIDRLDEVIMRLSRATT